jgi:hypothetical protein
MNSCDDGLFCTVNDTCSNGACTGEPNCDDDIACTADSCDEATKSCDHAPNNAACDDDNVCTDDSCDPESGCVHMGNANSCDDGNECTAGDTCSGGTCEPGTTAVACKVTGGGGLTTGGDKVSFGFNAQTGSFKGQLEYHNHTQKTTYHSVSIDPLVITPIISCSANASVSGKRATFTGMIKKKGNPTPQEFTVMVEDCGEPGRNDFFDISIPVYSESRSGPLDRGNIQVH